MHFCFVPPVSYSIREVMAQPVRLG